MPDLSYLQGKSFAVVLVYDDGTEQGDWRIFPGTADWCDNQLLIHPKEDLQDFLIPARAYDNISPVTPEISILLDGVEYFVVLHIAPVPNTIPARFVGLE